ncbi:hypothetical protein [Sinorhizobium medicae]|uniref:hypothetical protein n=1 Tax=Sinorhizobium medicae TaxID=110321 RepID=UPI000FDAC643|nr:hypothetical protein [Sinorhizobium medicae]RVP48119.1 hypothetical protein CN078_25590 [Sinorhizobium medicae]RVP75406.1 hypothetical protein CN079_19910 [Sinorhizobium medicae]UWU06621.1 hypothetical protein N2598_09505 [Sinorhizobium medicae]
MEKKTKSAWSLLNPLEWLQTAFALLAAVFGPLLRWLGMLTPPRTDGFENIQQADVDDAQKLAVEQEAAVDAITREMSPADVVRAYAKADAADRASMDLSALDFDQQDWLLGLSDEDLDKLTMLTKSGCARSLEQRKVLPLYRKPPPETETPEIYAIPSEEDIEQAKMDFVSARFRELFLAPGVPNPNPKFVSTLH